jgi:hypothetical protein
MAEVGAEVEVEVELGLAAEDLGARLSVVAGSRAAAASTREAGPSADRGLAPLSIAGTSVAVTEAMSDTSAAAARSVTRPTAITTIPMRTVVAAITTGALSQQVAPIGGTDITIVLATDAACRARVREGLLGPSCATDVTAMHLPASRVLFHLPQSWRGSDNGLGARLSPNLKGSPRPARGGAIFAHFVSITM